MKVAIYLYVKRKYQNMIFLYVLLYVYFILIKILVNYSVYNYYVVLNYYYYISVLNFNPLYLWFILFMYIIILQIFYYSTKLVYNKMKLLLILMSYFLLYIVVLFLFLSDDCILFIVSFESMLFVILAVSMYFIFNNRFIIAMYYLITFTIISGVLCFLTIIILFLNINISGYLLFSNTIILNNLGTTILLWITIYIIFGIKFPIYPFYFWLLAVHVEVSSEISTLLAGIILKAGFIGILKFLLVMLSYVTNILSNTLSILVIIGLIACVINLLLVTDYKKIVGFWSLLHVNVTLLFVWYSNNMLTLLFILSNLGHIISSSSFFLCLSFTYENFNNRHLFLISSSFNFNINAFLFVFLLLNNIDFPLFLLFYVELLNFFAVMFISNYLLILLCSVVIVLFTSSLIVYFALNYYQSKWNNKYIRFDINILDYVHNILLILYTLILYWCFSILTQ